MRCSRRYLLSFFFCFFFFTTSFLFMITPMKCVTTEPSSYKTVYKCRGKYQKDTILLRHHCFLYNLSLQTLLLQLAFISSMSGAKTYNQRVYSCIYCTRRYSYSSYGGLPNKRMRYLNSTALLGQKAAGNLTQYSAGSYGAPSAAESIHSS